MKSQPPEFPWQESVAIFKIADQLGARDLRKMALTAWKADVISALNSTAALRFVQDLWDVDNEGLDNLRSIVITEAVKNPANMTAARGFQEFLGRHPDFALQLIKGQQEEVMALKAERPSVLVGRPKRKVASAPD